MTDTKYGITWYGYHEGESPTAMAQTGYEFDADMAATIGMAGANATDFWSWADAQSFKVDGTSDPDKTFTLTSAVAETENQDGEFDLWLASNEVAS